MTWILANLATIWQDTVAHLAVALPPIVISFFLSIPIGWAVVRLRRGKNPLGDDTQGARQRPRFGAGLGGSIITFMGLLYAVPSLPLFIVMPVVLGTGYQDPINVVIALSLYGLALMVRSTVDALESIDAPTLQAATAMGYSPAQRFFRVELPLAGPVLLAGLRVVAVSTISLTTVGAVLGIVSLGSLFTDGLQRNIPEEILSGIIMVLVLALVVDGVLVLLGRIVLPWARRAPRRTARRAARTLQTAEATS